MKKNLVLLIASFILFVSSTYAVVISNENNAPPIKTEDVSLISKDALKAFHSLSRSERKARLKEAKKYWKENRHADSDASTNKVLLAILAILLPPLAVYLHENAVNSKFWISILLTLIFWIPGVIYALIVVL
jgi:uncharacterized membrane protein YqaE (UPF0057 family)